MAVTPIANRRYPWNRLTTLYIDKERHKFSAAHYTIFSATERERLHGHNYSVSARIVAPMGDNGFAADYNVYKRRLASLCEALDEYMLLAGESPYQQIRGSGRLLPGDLHRRSRCSSCKATRWCCRSAMPRWKSFPATCCRAWWQLSAGDDLREIELCVASGPGPEGLRQLEPAADPGVAICSAQRRIGGAMPLWRSSGSMIGFAPAKGDE